MNEGKKLQLRRPTSAYGSFTNRPPASNPAANSRPHGVGGYRGISEQYPLSVNAFDKPTEYKENVKNNVNAQYLKEENNRSGSPQWVPRYNSDINHTGEQPLIVHHFLSGNKEEQRNGVLPAHADVPPRLKPASHHYRGEERQDYYHGNSTHQYLTATEMPGQSHQLFDIRHGRPTRTSLLRTRHRYRSAPGVRALLEVNYLHKQQYLSAKTEDKIRNAEIPKDLQPLTEGGETIHQFIVGAKYNRNVFRDPRCLAATHIPRRGQPQYFPNGSRVAENGNFMTSSSETLTSTNFSSRGHPNKTKEAWGSEPSLTKSRPMSSRTGPPTPTPQGSKDTTPFGSKDNTPLASREAFSTTQPSIATVGYKQPFIQSASPTSTKTIIDGSALHDVHTGTGGGGCEDCVMCRKGVPFKGMPGTFSKKSDMVTKKNTGGTGQDGGDRVKKYVSSMNRRKSDTLDHQLMQNYHLRILGIKKNDEENRPQTPTMSTKHHYSLNTSRPRPSSSRSQLNKNKNNNVRRSKSAMGRMEDKEEAKDEEFDRVSQSGVSTRSSMISVRISTHEFENEDAMSEPTPDATPRNEEITPRSGDDTPRSDSSPSPRGKEQGEGTPGGTPRDAGVNEDTRVRNDRLEESEIGKPTIEDEESKNSDAKSELNGEEKRDEFTLKDKIELSPGDELSPCDEDKTETVSKDDELSSENERKDVMHHETANDETKDDHVQDVSDNIDRSKMLVNDNDFESRYDGVDIANEQHRDLQQINTTDSNETDVNGNYQNVDENGNPADLDPASNEEISKLDSKEDSPD